MRLSKQHKVYLGVLGVAGIGLIVDRTMLGPSEAAAVATESYLVEPSTSDAGAKSDAARAVRDASRPGLAQRLKSIGTLNHVDPTMVNDVFQPAWKRVEAAPPVETPAETAMAAATARFLEQHRLTAVMGSGPNGAAIINGRCVRIGQSIAGFTLLAVAERSATFQAAEGGSTVQLNVKIVGAANEGADSAQPLPD